MASASRRSRTSSIGFMSRRVQLDEDEREALLRDGLVDGLGERGRVAHSRDGPRCLPLRRGAALGRAMLEPDLCARLLHRERYRRLALAELRPPRVERGVDLVGREVAVHRLSLPALRAAEADAKACARLEAATESAGELVIRRPGPTSRLAARDGRPTKVRLDCSGTPRGKGRTRRGPTPTRYPPCPSGRRHPPSGRLRDRSPSGRATRG